MNFESAVGERAKAMGRAIRGTLRPLFGVAEPGPKMKLKEEQERKYPSFEKWMDSLPPPVPWQESPRLMREIEREVLRRACEMHNCKGPETLEEEQQRLKKMK